LTKGLFLKIVWTLGYFYLNRRPTHDIFSPSKATLVFLFLSHLLPSFFTFSVEEAACRRDRLPKSTSSKLKLDHPNLAKAARQHPWSYALYLP
jgi:hypothetical protein